MGCYSILWEVNQFGEAHTKPALTNSARSSGSGSCTSRDWLSFTSLIAQITSSFEGESATKGALQHPSLAAVKHLKDGRPDSTSLMRRSNSLGPACLRPLLNGTSSKTITPPLIPSFQPPSTPYFLGCVKSMMMGEEQRYPTLKQGRYNQGLAMTLIEWFGRDLKAHLVPTPHAHQVAHFCLPSFWALLAKKKN